MTFKIEYHISKQKGIPHYHVIQSKPENASTEIVEFIEKKDVQEYWSEDLKTIVNKCLDEVSYVKLVIWPTLY